MRIDGYPPFAPSAQPMTGRAPVTTPEENISAQEKFARLLDEKRWMAESAFEGNPSGELGKHIDLRV